MKYSIRYAAAALALLSAAAIPASPGTAQQAAQADLILRGGTVYPGGAAPFTGDVAIRGARITSVVPKAPGSAARIIAATGLFDSPVFTDSPSHVSDSSPSTALLFRLLLPSLPHVSNIPSFTLYQT